MCPCGGVLRPEQPTDHASNYRCFLVSRFGIKKSSSRSHRDNNILKRCVNCTENFQMWPVWLGRVRMGGSHQVWIFACTLMKSWWFISGAPEYVDFLKPVYSFFSSILHSICTFLIKKTLDSKYLKVKQRKKLQISGIWYFWLTSTSLDRPGRRNWPPPWKVDRAGTSSSCTTCFRLGRY